MKNSFDKRFITLKRGETEVCIRCVEETLNNFWGRTKDEKLSRFPKESWEVVKDEVKV
jgi:hypothetical protein